MNHPETPRQQHDGICLIPIPLCLERSRSGSDRLGLEPLVSLAKEKTPVHRSPILSVLILSRIIKLLTRLLSRIIILLLRLVTIIVILLIVNVVVVETSMR